MSSNLSDRFAELPTNLSSHIELVILALLCGVLVSVPLAVVLARRPRLRYPVLAIAGVIQTIPSLALLSLMVPILAYTGGLGLGLSSFGFYPALFALILYSVLPILRNTVTGLVGVEPALVEAARGLGMNPRQMLLRVQIPLAAPVILAGIRTATVWTVGTATLATPVGHKCLGNYIFAGLQTRNWLMVMFGVVAAALLAVIFDTLLGGIEKAVASRRRGLLMVSSLGVAVVSIAGLLAPKIVSAMKEQPEIQVASDREGSEGAVLLDSVKIGSKTFTEQYILAEVMRNRLQDAGVAVQMVESLGSNVVFDALVDGSIDIYVDYSGTIWANHMKRNDVPSRWEVLEQVEGWLASEHAVRSLGPLGFENTYALAVRRETAESLGLETIDDLRAHASRFSIGGDYEFFARPEWYRIRELYALEFKDTTNFDSSLMYEAVREKNVDVIAAFSSDGRIAAYDLVVLKDPAQAIPPYEAMILLSKRAADDARIVEALMPLRESISLHAMQRANFQVDREEDKRTVSEAARWLSEQPSP